VERKAGRGFEGLKARDDQTKALSWSPRPQVLGEKAPGAAGTTTAGPDSDGPAMLPGRDMMTQARPARMEGRMRPVIATGATDGVSRLDDRREPSITTVGS